MNTKRGCDFLATFISEMLENENVNFKCTSMHGDRTQQQREEALHAFRTGKCPIMIATNCAARGLDIKGVDLVINYDIANEVEDYVHRFVVHHVVFG